MMKVIPQQNLLKNKEKQMTIKHKNKIIILIT